MFVHATILPLDLKAEYEEIRGEIHAAVSRVLRSGSFILGREGEALEAEVAADRGCRHGVAVASGTDALHLALRAAGLGPGDELILPAFTTSPTQGERGRATACGTKPWRCCSGRPRR